MTITDNSYSICLQASDTAVAGQPMRITLGSKRFNDYQNSATRLLLNGSMQILTLMDASILTPPKRMTKAAIHSSARCICQDMEVAACWSVHNVLKHHHHITSEA